MACTDTADNLILNNGQTCSIQLCVEPNTSHTPEFLKEQIIHALNSMSARTRWLRFASAGRLTNAQLDYLTRLDGRDRVAWCAAICQNGKETGIGLSRYIKLADEEGVAEFAVTVIDAYQRQGVGTALLTQLIESARQNGISTLRGYILASNTAMLAMAKKFGAVLGKEDANFIVVEIATDKELQ